MANATPEELKSRILADPNTAKLAEELGLPLDEYVGLVLQYALNPTMEPELYIVEDANLRAAGFEPPDLDKMGAYIKETYEVMTVTERSQYDKPSKPLPVPPAATADPDKVDKREGERISRELRLKGGKL